MFQKLCALLVLINTAAYAGLAAFGQGGFKFVTDEPAQAQATFAFVITDYDKVTTKPTGDNRPVMDMLIPDGDWCKYCNEWKARGDKDLPVRINPVVVDKQPRYGYPTFRVRGKDGQDWFIGNPGTGDAQVASLMTVWRRVTGEMATPELRQTTGDAAASQTPYSAIASIFESEIKPGQVVVDPGCGDGRALIVAVEQFHATQGIGVEIDPVRADAARARVREAGLSNKIEIITGDSTKMSLKGDVLFAYLYPQTLSALNLDNFSKVISYMHPIPGRTGTKRDQFYVYTKSESPKSQTAQTTTQYEWKQVYVAPWQTGRQCGNGSCVMCYGGMQWKQVPTQVASHVSVPQQMYACPSCGRRR